MAKSKIFYTEQYQSIEKNIKDFLNSAHDFLSPRTITSPRAVGDAVQDLLAENIKTILGSTIKDYSSNFARRAMADLAFFDKDNLYYVVDVKTHCLETQFNMPNLISVERLARFYEDDNNNFLVLICPYSISGTHLQFRDIHFVPIEFLSWNCLTIGALGWGQIQISNSNNIKIIPSNSRRKWMLELCERLFEFYPLEISKINSRINHFKNVQKFWKKKTE